MARTQAAGKTQWLRESAHAVARVSRRKPLGFISGVIIFAVVIIAFAAPLITQYPPAKITADTIEPPSGAHWFGTDNLGRDAFSRIVFGSRISLLVGLLAASLGTTAGGAIGIFSGYFGGRVDLAVQRLIDIMMSFPTIILALSVGAILGPSLQNVIIAIALPIVPRATRVVRSSVIAVVRTAYVEAATSVGCSNLRIMLRHVAPNCLAPFLVILTAQFGIAILMEASLGFLGYGVPAPTPTWGGMLSGEAQRFFYVAPWMAVAPGVAITLVVLAFNLAGDALRDISDPRLRGV